MPSILRKASEVSGSTLRFTGRPTAERSARCLASILIVPIVAAAVLITLTTRRADGAPPTQSWISRYSGNGIGNNQITGMAMDPSGDIVVTGYTSGSWWDMATVKYSPSGRQLHAARYNGPAGGDDVPMAVAVDLQGNIFVAGYTDGNGEYNYDFVTVKYDSTLTQQWVQTYAGQFNIGLDEAYAIKTDASGDAYVTGFSFEAATGNDYVTIKYNPAGVQQWVQRFNGQGNSDDGANDIQVDADGNAYVTGGSQRSPNGGNYDFATIKYSSSGVQQWVQTYDGPADRNDGGIALALDSSRNVYVTGYQTGIGSQFDVATIKYNNAGVQQWVRTHNGAGNSFDAGKAIALDHDANVYVTGYETGTHGDSDYSTIKYDTAGTEKWVETYDGPVHGFDEGQAIAVDADENVYVIGYSDGGVGAVNYDFATLKYDSNGVQQWGVRYNGPGNNLDTGEKILLDGAGHVIVSGWSTGLRDNLVDFATIEYDQGAPADVPPDAGALALRLLGAAPNPFVSSTSIRFELPSAGPVEIAIFDASGRSLGTKRWDRLAAGFHAETLSGAGLPAGTYFYDIKAGLASQTGKLTRRN